MKGVVFSLTQYGVIISGIISIFAMLEIVKKVVDYSRSKTGNNREAAIIEFLRRNSHK